MKYLLHFSPKYFLCNLIQAIYFKFKIRQISKEISAYKFKNMYVCNKTILLSTNVLFLFEFFHKMLTIIKIYIYIYLMLQKTRGGVGKEKKKSINGNIKYFV